MIATLLSWGVLLINLIGSLGHRSSNRTNLLHFVGRQLRHKFRETAAIVRAIGQTLLVKQ